MLREDVADVLDGLAEEVNLANPDQLDALSEATIALELAAPARIIKIDKDAVPTPDRIRERVNHLIHELTPLTGGARSTGGTTSGTRAAGDSGSWSNQHQPSSGRSSPGTAQRCRCRMAQAVLGNGGLRLPR
jgi:hypothetical protein